MKKKYFRGPCMFKMPLILRKWRAMQENAQEHKSKKHKQTRRSKRRHRR